jgi:hypothetical protein
LHVPGRARDVPLNPQLRPDAKGYEPFIDSLKAILDYHIQTSRNFRKPLLRDSFGALFRRIVFCRGFAGVSSRYQTHRQQDWKYNELGTDLFYLVMD